MGDWVDTTLGELVLLQRGMDLPSRLREPGPFAVLGSNGPVGTHSEGPVEGPGVVIGRATNLGRPTWWWDNYWPLNTCLYVRDFRGNDPRFVYYLFESLDLSGFDSGSVQPMLNRNYIAQVPLLVPPLPEQRAIAEVLGGLDDKIESNRRIVEKLDAIAQLTYLESESDSWVEMTLRDCAELLPGKYLSKDEYGAFGAYPVFGSNSRMGRGPRFLYEGPVIAMARIGSNFGAVMWSTESAWINNNASGVRTLPGFDLKHIFYWLRAFDFESIRRGSGQPFVAHEDLYAQVIRLPQDEERQRISESVSAMFHIIDQRERENLVLESARDTLLPALLSGRIRVPAAAELVEAR